MQIDQFVRQRVHDYFSVGGMNCAITTLKIMGELFDINLDPQLFDAAVGMPGAGGLGGQCGLVGGGLMFLGIYGMAQELTVTETSVLCRGYAAGFQERFGDLRCSVLRPQGFGPNVPSDVCDLLAVDTILFGIDYLGKTFDTAQEIVEGAGLSAG